MKKILSIILCLALFLSFAVVASAAGDTATLEFKKANRTTGTTSQNIYTANGITVTSNKDKSSSNLIQKDDHIRLYANSSLKIEYPGMTYVVFTVTANEYVDPLVNSVKSLGTTTKSGTNVTLVLNSAQDSITFSLTAQVRLSSLTVGTGDAPTAATAPSDPKEIVDAAFKLSTGASLPYECSLTGTIKSVGTAYDASYKNVTFTMEVEGTSGKKDLLCFRAKAGTGLTSADLACLAKGDVVTVKGTIKNYNGTIEFDAGCQVTKVVPGSNRATAPTNVADIEKAANALKKNTALNYLVTLSGKVTKIDAKWDSSYKNITVTVQFDGFTKALQCYRLASGKADASKIGVGDTITVTGLIVNYNGTLQFDQGSVLDAHTPHTCDWLDATCTDAKKCSLCGKTEGAALGHNEVVDKAVDATCTEDGLTEGSHCDRCDKVLVAQETVPAIGHADDDANFICDVCNAELCTNHSLTKVSAKEPTTKAPGNSEYYICEICGEWFSDAEGENKIADRTTVIIPQLVEFNVLVEDLKDGDVVVIYSPFLKEVMTSVHHTYEGSYTKIELDGGKASVKGNKISYDKGLALTVKVNSDKTVSFITANGKYLYADGTDVKLVSKAGDNTKFVLEEAKGGYKIKCANATYKGDPQYLEVYSGYFTCYGYREANADQYVFQFYSVDSSNPKDGDSISVFVALMAVSAVGAAVVLKKKEF